MLRFLWPVAMKRWLPFLISGEYVRILLAVAAVLNWELGSITSLLGCEVSSLWHEKGFLSGQVEQGND